MPDRPVPDRRAGTRPPRGRQTPASPSVSTDATPLVEPTPLVVPATAPEPSEGERR